MQNGHPAVTVFLFSGFLFLCGMSAEDIEAHCIEFRVDRSDLFRCDDNIAGFEVGLESFYFPGTGDRDNERLLADHPCQGELGLGAVLFSCHRALHVEKILRLGIAFFCVLRHVGTIVLLSLKLCIGIIGAGQEAVGHR